MSSWTEERDEQMRALFLQGLSFRHIAEGLGGFENLKDFGRNAVIGRVHRLGWHNNYELMEMRKINTSHCVAPARNLKPRAARPKRIGAENTVSGRVAARRRQIALVQSTTDPDAVPVSTEFLGIKFMDLEPDQCRYPRGDGASMLFCGQPVVRESSYCSHCYGIVYVPPKPPSEKKANERQFQYYASRAA